MDTDDIVKEIEQNLEWFCDKIVEPVPLNPEDKQKVFPRMINLGWIRQSEVDIYNEITKDD
jgi:poly-beta-hydroxyalkanoate depolymerase